MNSIRLAGPGMWKGATQESAVLAQSALQMVCVWVMWSIETRNHSSGWEVGTSEHQQHRGCGSVNAPLTHAPTAAHSRAGVCIRCLVSVCPGQLWGEERRLRTEPGHGAQGGLGAHEGQPPVPVPGAGGQAGVRRARRTGRK